LTIPDTDAVAVTDRAANLDPGSQFDRHVVALCRELIQLDTTSRGDGRPPETQCNERPAAEYVADRLRQAGLEPTLVDAAPNRTSVIARVPGRDSAASALLVHGHLDVVPAQAADWTHPPFAGEIADAQLWGRGAIDMKDMLAMMLAVVSKWHALGEQPRREIVFAFLADEEAGGHFGSHWLVENRPELFDRCSEAISEVGGFSWTAPSGRLVYFIETARKGVAWRKLTARGASGHASMPVGFGAVQTLCAAVTRISEHKWERRLTPTTSRMLAVLSDVLELDLDRLDDQQLWQVLGPAAQMIVPSLTHTATPTGLAAGVGSVNVIPAEATAFVDARFVPGARADLDETLARLAGPDVEVSVIDTDEGQEYPFDTALVERMVEAIHAHDPDAVVVPYCLTASSDNTAFGQLGIHGYGFVPLQLPPELAFAELFHAKDERIPISTLQFGARCLDTFLLNC
jgi:acetylornithine deacetylase/succinyl-diaminopimelate desuccinylase-like protein